MTETDFDPYNDVVTALRALLARDRKTVLRLSSDWTQAHIDALAVWALEAHSRSFRVYASHALPEVPEGLPGAVLQTLSRLRSGSPTLVAKYLFLTL